MAGSARDAFVEARGEAYLRTYVERDLPHLGVTTDPLLLRRLLTMLAHAQGGLFNASQFARSLGISYHTVQRYVGILTQTFLVRRLPPFLRNVGKRLASWETFVLEDLLRRERIAPPRPVLLLAHGGWRRGRPRDRSWSHALRRRDQGRPR